MLQRFAEELFGEAFEEVAPAWWVRYTSDWTDLWSHHPLQACWSTLSKQDSLYSTLLYYSSSSSSSSRLGRRRRSPDALMCSQLSRESHRFFFFSFLFYSSRLFFSILKTLVDDSFIVLSSVVVWPPYVTFFTPPSCVRSFFHALYIILTAWSWEGSYFCWITLPTTATHHTHAHSLGGWRCRVSRTLERFSVCVSEALIYTLQIVLRTIKKEEEEENEWLREDSSSSS